MLEVINSSPSDLAPIFDAILEKALWVCSATFGMMSSHDNGRLTNVAARGLPAAYNNWRLEHPLKAHYGSFGYPPTLQRVLAGEAVVHEPDLMASEAYRRGHPDHRALVDLAGARSQVTVALRNNHGLLGTIMIFRQEVRPFSDKEIRLLQNFAAQAVIAIESARLLNELRQRTDDLSESLERQTATTEILSVISSSPGELKLVFDAVLENAVRICHAKFGNLTLYDGNQMRVAAMYNAPSAFERLRREDPVIPLHKSILGLLVASKQITHSPDLTSSEPTASSSLVKVAGAKAALAVPMLHESELARALIIYRDQPGWFTDKQAALTNFAAQPRTDAHGKPIDWRDCDLSTGSSTVHR